MSELQLDDVSVRGPDGVLRVRRATGTMTGLTAFHAEAGSGAGWLLAALTGELPPGSRVAGQARLDGRDLLRSSPDELHGVVTRAGLHLVPGVRTGEFLHWCDASPADAGLSGREGTRTVDLPVDLRARLAVLALEAVPAEPLLVVHPMVSALDTVWRRRAVAELRRRAGEGQCVVWWDDDPASIAVADHTWGFRGAHLLTDAHVPPPPPAEPLRRHLPRLATVPAEELDLRGPDLDVADGETLGLVRLDGRVEPLARALVARLPQGEIIPTRLSPQAAGSHDASRWLLARDREVPVWFPHPQVGLDTTQREQLITHLRRPPATRLVTTRDTDLLQRACHRVAVVRGTELLRVASPAAVADLLGGAA